MDERIVKFRIGVVVLATLIIVAILVLLFGETPALVRSKYTVYMHFPQAPGVTQDTPVRKFGILIGRVTEVEFDEVRGGVTVAATINEKVKLRKNEIPRISGTLLGDAVIQFVPSGPPAPEFITSGELIEGDMGTNPLELLSNLQGDLGQAIGSVSTAGTEVTKLAGHVNDLLASNDEQINRIINKTERALDGFQQALVNVNGVFGDDKTRADLRKSIGDLPALLAETRQAINSMQQTMGLADRNLRNLEGFTRPLGQRGEELVVKVDQSVGRLDELLAQFVEFGKALNRREGSLGQLMTNPDLYQNLNAAACNIEQLTRDLKPIVRDARTFADKIARHPEVLGVRGAISSSPGIK